MRVVAPASLPISRPPRPPRGAASVAASAIAPPKPASEPPSLFERALNGVRSMWDRFFPSLAQWRNPAAKAPVATSGLKLISYNILLGGQRIEQVEADLKRLRPDVACLQEATEPSARALAEKLGMHMSYCDGKAILSRYPFASVEHEKFGTPLLQRLAAYVRGVREGGSFQSIEPLYERGMLHASIRVGDRTVDVIDTHLSLKDPTANAQQIAKLADRAAKLQAQGHTVLAAGDFNTNFALAEPGTADAAGGLDTETDTLAEYRDRYGANVGNIADAKDLAAARKLLGTMETYWAAPDRLVRTSLGDLTPEQARAELASGQVAPGSARFQALRFAADGVSHKGAHKRFDNIFASRDVEIASAYQDHVTTGSDHQPVMTEVRW